MGDRLVKSILTIIVAAVLFVIAIKLVTWAVFKILPIAIIIVAAYIVYRIITGKRG